MILAEMWRKKIEAMKDSERTRTMNGSLYESEWCMCNEVGQGKYAERGPLGQYGKCEQGRTQ